MRHTIFGADELPPALRDYRRIAKQCKHLDNFLDPEQVSAALKMAHGSKGQLDFIIAADEYGACNDELRTVVYRLFELESVTTSTG